MKKLLCKFMMTKDEGDKAIVVEVGLAVIAILLLVIFKDEMGAFIKALVDGMEGELSTILGLKG